MVVGDGGLEEMQEAREAEGELGRDDRREARDEVSEVGEETVAEDDGGGTGISDKVTSMMGSVGSEVTISQYLSWSRGDIDW